MRILTALDHSEYAEIVLEHGLDQAARAPSAELHFATVVAGAAERDEARRWLAAMVREGLDDFEISERTPILHVREGLVAPALVELATELAVDLLVMGQFHVPSQSKDIVELGGIPTLVVGIDGVVLDPQCHDCGIVRLESRGERLFCERHTGDWLPDLTSRLPPSMVFASRMW